MIEAGCRWLSIPDFRAHVAANTRTRTRPSKRSPFWGSSKRGPLTLARWMLREAQTRTKKVAA